MDMSMLMNMLAKQGGDGGNNPMASLLPTLMAMNNGGNQANGGRPSVHTPAPPPEDKDVNVSLFKLYNDGGD